MARLRAAQEKILDRRSEMDELRARRCVHLPELAGPRSESPLRLDTPVNIVSWVRTHRAPCLEWHVARPSSPAS